MNNNAPLDHFGADFINNVRDASLHTLTQMLAGKMQDRANQQLHQQIATLDEAQRAAVCAALYKAVDLTLHNTLFFFEQNIGDWRIAYSAQGVDDLAALSDGLCGELYTEDGWIARHSEYPPLEAVLAVAMAQENGDKAA